MGWLVVLADRIFRPRSSLGRPLVGLVRSSLESSAIGAVWPAGRRRSRGRFRPLSAKGWRALIIVPATCWEFLGTRSWNAILLEHGSFTTEGTEFTENSISTESNFFPAHPTACGGTAAHTPITLCVLCGSSSWPRFLFRPVPPGYPWERRRPAGRAAAEAACLGQLPAGFPGVAGTMIEAG